MCSNVEDIKSDTETNEITYQLVKTLLYNYEDMKEASNGENDLMFNYICSFSSHIYKLRLQHCFNEQKLTTFFKCYIQECVVTNAQKN